MTHLRDIKCEQCDHVIGRVKGGRIKIQVRSRLMVIKGTHAELTCPRCRKDTNLPLVYEPQEVSR